MTEEDDTEEDESPESSHLPVRFGDYELLEELGRGGMGIVFRARHVRLGHEVALKRLCEGALAHAEMKRRFWDEARFVVRLRHPNIVPIHEVREHEGQPYFTMDLMSGGTLEDALGRFRGPRRAAALVAKLARAAHAYHGNGKEKGIIHRDLKPVNILFHTAPDEPYIADFGIAKDLDSGNATQTNASIGTPHYMAPEQHPKHPARISCATDVWSLGVILYELLAERRPFDGPTTDDIRRSAAEDEPTSLYELRPAIGRELAAVCHMCLRKEPERRYHSAEALAEDLERYLNYEAVLAREPTRRARIWWWSLRHPTTAGVVAGAALFLISATGAALSVAAAQESDRRQEVLRANEYTARWIAGTVLYKLKEYHDDVVKAAGGLPPDLIEKLRHTDATPRLGDPLDGYCHEVYDRHTAAGGGLSLFDTWFILDKNGRDQGHWPPPPVGPVGKQYEWRDYFKGAWERAQQRSRLAYVSRAFTSETSGNARFAIAAPIYDEKNEPIGVMVAMTDTGATLGKLELGSIMDDHHIAAIVAPLDNERAFKDAPLPSDHIIVVHSFLARGATETLGNNAAVHRATELADRSNPGRDLDQLRLTGMDAVSSEAGHCDPVKDGDCRSVKPHAGRWLAGFAPVGNTGFVAIVETLRDDAAHPNETLLRRLLLWGGLPFAICAALLAFAVRHARRRLARNAP
jgi:serine/threonine-protein kinase